MLYILSSWEKITFRISEAPTKMFVKIFFSPGSDFDTFPRFIQIEVYGTEISQFGVATAHASASG